MLRTVSLLNYLQDAAGVHARQLGVSVADLRSQGLTWVLSRLHLIVDRPIHGNCDVLVRTWPASRAGHFTCREFEVLDMNGDKHARATSSWAVLSLQTRRPVRIDDFLPEYPLLARRAIEDDFTTIPVHELREGGSLFKVGRADLDVNRHMNNTVHVAWALETVPDDVFESCRLEELEVGYRSEAFAGEEVLACLSSVVEPHSKAFLHSIYSSSDGREIARLRTRWR